MTENSKQSIMLSKLLIMHEQNQLPETAFIVANADIFEELWAKGLSCFRITRMAAGNIRPRHMYSGVLTPTGIVAAKALQL